MPDPAQPAGAPTPRQTAPEAGDTTLSPLDSGRFGLVVARNPRVTCATLAAANTFCQRQRAALLIARCPAGDVPTVHCLEGDGFRWMDTLVYWRRALMDKPIPARAHLDGLSIRPLRGEDAPGVAALARAAFTDYGGHYHADARLNADAAIAVYVDWAANCCAEPGFADIVFGVEDSQQILGFMALKEVGQGTCDISLVAVAPAVQGRGLFRALLVEALHWMADRAFVAAEYSCILTNIGAQAGLARVGFELDHAVHTFHKWFDS
ncbi:MAG TPA: GNAT family N-acetyltransferase [Ktedonobacterales bacterium]|jgi:ribosomal protein S18 acetylase RimI-like enzyme